ncbi:hypothetical protein [Flavisolibacter ginsenosidimutans]|uniref:Lipoprotein n=1 Tax=Flavisolibacter ginsenosidimutans TaxID=661481 RepID=A0A5B8UDU5_9BACT|nr:hypothetical protein [Flavisolibacter ginsenosidimutans]QEC54592.1 hypothetical protein FSB75_01320 [Flavisolibacter ginsenosidimutans]
MKSIQQTAAEAVIFLSLFGASCEKTASSSASLKDAVITGFDQRACPCCGGLMINFSGETQPYTGTFYLVDNDPAEFKISTASAFPIAVRVQYSALDKCFGKYVRISKLERK